MYWDVVEVTAEPEHTLALRFADGLEGRVRFDLDFFTGVLAPLVEPQLFARAGVENGAVVWPGGIGLAPEVLYEQVRMEQSARDALT